jgi:hypothetical protein
MVKEQKRVAVESSVDLQRLAEEIAVDGEPRIIESNGRPIAALIGLHDLDLTLLPTPDQSDTAAALQAAGAWKDLDTMIEEIYRERHPVPTDRRSNSGLPG